MIKLINIILFIAFLGVSGLGVFVLPELEGKVDAVGESLEQLEENTEKVLSQVSTIPRNQIDKVNEPPLDEKELQRDSISRYISKLMSEKELLKKQIQKLEEKHQVFRGNDDEEENNSEEGRLRGTEYLEELILLSLIHI